MSDRDTLLEQLHRLTSDELRAVSRRLERGEVQSLIFRAAQKARPEDLELIERLMAHRRDREDSQSLELADPAETTILSWRDLEALPGGARLTSGLDGLLEWTAPFQEILRETSIDAFGVEIGAWQRLLERYFSIREPDWEVVMAHSWDAENVRVDLDATTLGLTWFGRGPHVRRRPLIYLIAGGGLEWGTHEDREVEIAPFVATYGGPDEEITAESWTEWFASVSLGPDTARLGGTSLSLSWFRSVDGPLEAMGSFAEELSRLSHEMTPPREETGWRGWSLQFHPDEPPSSTVRLGSSFYK